MREHSQTRPQYNQATLLLGKNLIYKARWTTFMYLFMAIKAISNIEATPICCGDMTPFLGQISSYRVKGHRKDFSR